MGRVPGVPAEAGQCVHGDAEVARVHGPLPQGAGVPGHLRRGPRLRRHRQGDDAVHDVTAPERPPVSVL